MLVPANTFAIDKLYVSVAGCLGYDVLVSKSARDSWERWFQLLVV